MPAAKETELLIKGSLFPCAHYSTNSAPSKCSKSFLDTYTKTWSGVEPMERSLFLEWFIGVTPFWFWSYKIQANLENLCPRHFMLVFEYMKFHETTYVGRAENRNKT